MASHPVYYRMGRTFIGNATCERGAIACATRRSISKMRYERWTARLADLLIEPDDPDGPITWQKVWFVGVQLRPR